MLLRAAELIVSLLESYVAVGFAFAVLFLPRAALRMDEGLRHAPVAVRLLILPGVIALWPLFAVRWARGTPPPIERNAHRDKAARA